MKKIFTLIMLLFLLIGCGKEKAADEEVKGGIKKIELKEVEKKITEDTGVIIDIRSYDEYNGWDINNTGVEGHIPGAVNMPVKTLDYKKLDKTLERKGVTKEDDITLYGEGAGELAQKMDEGGYKVSVFHEGEQKWNEAGNTLDKLPNKNMVVPVSWVKDLLEGKEVAEYDGRPVMVFNAGWDETGKAHTKGHIPGSYWVHLGWVEEGPLWNRVSDEKIKTELEKLGVTKDTLVIVYGKDQTPAARFGIIAKYMGVEDVRLINGGLKAWEAAGYEVAKDEEKPQSVKEFGAEKPLHPELIIDHPEAIDYLESSNSDLVSIRSWKEYTGETSGYDYIQPRGRIKGSKWGMGGTDPWHLQDYRGIDEAHMRPYTELAKMWNDLKIDTENKLAFYCGTGWRASEVWFYAQAMGIDTTSIYDGGWNEWSTEESTKESFLRGEPKKLNEEKYID